MKGLFSSAACLLCLTQAHALISNKRGSAKRLDNRKVVFAGGSVRKTKDLAHSEKGENGQALLRDVVESQLHVSKMIYGLASLRKVVRRTRKDRRHKITRRLIPKLNWHRPDLIFTQDAGEDFVDKVRFKRYLKYPITTNMMAKFCDHDENWKILDAQKDISTDEHDEGNLKKMIQGLKAIGGEIVEFDDEFTNRELVYALIVNKKWKRITLTFRGSTTKRDWRADLRSSQTKPLPVPENLEGVELKHPIRIHKGFHSYLFKHSRKERGWNPYNVFGKVSRRRTKFDDIRGQILAQYKKPEYKKFDLYVSGHSLGGGLTQYLAYHLAGSKKIMDTIPGPVTAVSFASPKVGNRGYRDAFHELEKKGHLRHIRVTNEADFVPVVPFGFGYRQTGINLHVYPRDTMEVSYQEPKDPKSQLRKNPKKTLARHNLSSYREHLFKNKGNHVILDENTVEDLYKKLFGAYE